MRDAFGGAFMIKVFLVFIFIYIVFTAVAINYAKAFKVKNTVVEYLENNEIVDLTKASSINAMEEYFEKEILGGLNYNAEISCSGAITEDYYCNPIGVVISKTNKRYDQNTEGVYYTVSTYVKWDLGFLKILLNLNSNSSDLNDTPGTWKISGQTRLIVNE